ncbi:4'-phosphopantetheinyl transferase superfamily protein [Salinisphaera sp.]|uniref:4'-phosphopantetheinyl transferase family protein n=1 Tax=Salinisphaera sp. TaxID=1914330 RepID=UPI0025FF9743|nr:4'-phosphopantetheinyl transferase superfamily protein [Salinisphaera sp.]
MIRVVYALLNARTGRRLAARDARHDPPAYRDRLARMKSDEARSRSRAGLWLLQQTLADAGHPHTTLGRIDISPDGRPFIDGAPMFSISHSESLVACALGDGSAIGLDVEYRRPRDMQRMARLLDAPEQRHVIDEPTAFFDYWCAREATVKASGRVGLKRIRALALDGDTARLDDRTWWLNGLELADGYAACLAGDSPFEAIDIRDFSDRLAENTDR